MVRVCVLSPIILTLWASQTTDAITSLRVDAELEARQAEVAIESVNQETTPDVDCILSTWQPDPDGVCDPDTLKQPYKRTIVVAQSGNGKACGSPLEQDMPCKPVHCEMGPWSDWTTCENGVKSRERDIVTYPNAVGRACPFARDEVKCRKQDCQVCKWSEWVCDPLSGDQERTRRVVKPKELDGADCPHLSEKKACDPIPCTLEDRSTTPLDSEWGACVSDGNGGYHQTYVLKIVADARFKGTCPSETDPSRLLTRSCEMCAAPQFGAYFSNVFTIGVWKDISQSECCSKCSETEGCTSYTFLPSTTSSTTGDCYGKTRVTLQASGLSNRYVSATVANPKSCPAPPQGLTEGQSISCEDGRVYRYTCGQIRYYPDPTIAASWDPFWLTHVTAQSCENLVKGDPMAMKPCPAQPNGIAEGLAVKCDSYPAVYRSTCGEVRWYPDWNPDIARSWDITWTQQH